MAKIQITGGGFQDSEGNLLANGYLKMVLSQDCQVASTAQICSGIEVTVPLDGSGNVSGIVNVWPNDQLLPVNNFYTVTGYTQQGQRAWGPNVQQILGSTPFSLNTWVPNQLVVWNPTLTPISLRTNGSNNGSQSVLDLRSGTNISVTDAGNGQVTIADVGPNPPTLKTNGVNNGSQSTLNIAAGTNISVTDNGSGTVTIADTTPAPPAAMPIPENKTWFMWVPAPPILTSAQAGSNSLIAIGGDTLTTQSWNINGAGCYSPTSVFGKRWQPNSNYPGGPSTFAGSGGAYGSALTWIGRDIMCEGKIGAVAPIGNSRIWCGLIDSPATGAPDTFVSSSNPTTVKFIAFLYDGSANAHWQCGVGNGSATTFVTTSVTVTAGAPNKLKFVYTASNSTVQFFIDGTLVATINTNVPSNVAVSGIVDVKGVANVASDGGLTLEYFYVENAL